MPKFCIPIKLIYHTDIDVEAANADEALDKAQELFDRKGDRSFSWHPTYEGDEPLWPTPKQIEEEGQ